MKITQFDETQFRNLGGKTFKGDGFSVRVVLPLAVQYEEAGKILTVFAEPQDRTPEWANRWPILVRTFVARTWLDLVFEDPLQWDNSAEHPMTPEETIIGRVGSVLRRLHVEYRIRRVPAS